MGEFSRELEAIVEEKVRRDKTLEVIFHQLAREVMEKLIEESGIPGDLEDGKSFKCAECGSIFEKASTDEEAQEERVSHGWEDMPDKDMALVCDDCYKKIMAVHN